MPSNTGSTEFLWYSHDHTKQKDLLNKTYKENYVCLSFEHDAHPLGANQLIPPSNTKRNVKDKRNKTTKAKRSFTHNITDGRSSSSFVDPLSALSALDDKNAGMQLPDSYIMCAQWLKR